MKRFVLVPALLTLLGTVGAACSSTTVPNPLGNSGPGGSDPSGGGVISVTSGGSTTTGGATGGSGGFGGTGGSGGSSSSTGVGGSPVTTTSATTTSATSTTAASTTAASTTAASTTAAATTGSGNPVDCSGILNPNVCATCIEGSCCAQLANCDSVTGCLYCATGTASACTTANKNAVAGLNTCLDFFCTTECAPPPAADPTCTVPAISPSNGACVTLSATIKCNPVTNAPCNTAGGEACDTNGTGYECYAPPNDNNLCQPCGDTDGFCKGGQTCGNSATCAKYCCTNNDCGNGTCDKSGMLTGGVGTCSGGN